MYMLMAFLHGMLVLLSSSPVESMRLMQPVPQVNGTPTERSARTFFEVDRFLWPGCKITDEYPYEADLFGFGKCSLQPCSCQEVRATSVVWGFAGKCDRAPGQIVDFVATMRLDRDLSGTVTKYPQAIGTYPAQKVEFEFAEAMTKEMAASKWKRLQTPAVEHIGIKLGKADISLKSLRSTAGTLCSIYDASTLKGSDADRQQTLFQYALPEAFFDSHKMHTVAMEVRGAFPVTELFRTLGETLAHRTVGTVLVSVGQLFQMYEGSSMVHCDRSFNHILFRKSTLNRDMPGALAIDHDRVMSLENASWETTVLARQYMLEWFAMTVHNTCHLQEDMRLSSPSAPCRPDRPEKTRPTVRATYQRFQEIIEHGKSETGCKGSRFLRDKLVGPALLCSGAASDPDHPDDSCPLTISHWTKKLEDWAVKYYGQPFQKQSVLGPELFSQE